MRKREKRVLALAAAVCISLSCLGTSESLRAHAEGNTAFDMSATMPQEDRDWGKLRIDMGAAETNAQGYMGTPLANGIFSAKENGGVQEDIFPLNHSTFWSGDPEYRESLRSGEGGYQNSQKTRQTAYEELIQTLKNAYTEGISQEERDSLMESVAEKTQKMWEADEHSAFLPVGQMKLTFPELTDTTDYQRILDMDTASSEVSFQKNGIAYLRETFISNPDNVMVTRITNENNEPMDMELALNLPEQMNGKSDDNKVTVDSETGEVVMTARAPYDFKATAWDESRGTLLEARAKVVLPGEGNLVMGESTVTVQDASEIIVLYTCETSFKDAVTDPSASGVDYAGKVRNTMDAASAKNYEELRVNHLKEYRELFRSFWIDMDGENITAANGTQISPYEYARHYQYGRYINICCERENSIMPHGLLGMWSSTWLGPNEGAYFLNENIEKMHAIKGTGNLSDSSDGLYNFVSSWALPETGQKTARETYSAEEGAWMMSHSTGIWAKSGMWGGTVEYGSWLTGGIWVLDSLYSDYDYTQDIKTLQKIYPLMEGAAKFALSTLIEVDGVNGELKGYKVVAPTGSPEHWYWVGDTKVAFDIASACDTLLYYNLFNMMESGAKDLERAGLAFDEELLERVKEAKAQMIPLEMFIDESTGRFKEWYNEYPIGDEYHRHASHLLGFFLGHLGINEADTPELYYAQRAEMERWINANGGTHPDRSLMAVRAGFEDFAFANMTCGVVGTGYGHAAVMQWCPIASSVAEAVVDSRFDQINLMENLPEAWSSGTIEGIRAKGGYQLSISWENGELVSCVIDSPTGETPRVLYRGEPVVLSKDNRFQVNRAVSSLEDLQYEAQQKLAGKYTDESKQALQQALDSGDYDKISEALLGMTPVNYITTDIQVTAENGIHVLTESGQKLHLTAESEKEDAVYTWNIKATDGGSAEKIASVDQNGTVTAIGGGRVIVTVGIVDEPRSEASIELLIELESTKVKESLDDRDGRVQYSGNTWGQWDEAKHMNGTISYVLNEPGASATLEFEGTGIEFIGSKGGHIGDYQVMLDGEIVAERISGSEGELGAALPIYTNNALESGKHTITISALEGRIDIDGFNVYENIPASTDREELIRVYLSALKITEQDKYTEESWNAFDQARIAAEAAINNFEASQQEIEQAKVNLEQTQKGLVIKPAVNEWTEKLSIKGWTYGEKANAPSASAKYGKVIFAYSDEKNGTYTEDTPTEVGTWYVKAFVEATDKYTGLESEPVSFVISPKDDTSGTIDKGDKPSADTPVTGDSSNVWVWISLLVLTGSGGAYAIVRKQKRSRRR